MQPARQDDAQVQQEKQQQPQRWRSLMNASSNDSSSSPTDAEQGNDTHPNRRQSVSTPNANNANARRQIIGNYELGRVLATGDFDCRTRLCTHVTTGVAYVVRIYDKRVLAEAQWMWDRVAASIHVLRKLPRNRHVLEMVECFESNTSVYILMHLFTSMNLTKLFTDDAARAELLQRLHLSCRAAIRATDAARESHFTDGPDSLNEQEGKKKRNSNNSVSSAAMAERSSFRQLKDGRQGNRAVEMIDKEQMQRVAHMDSADEKKANAPVFHEALNSASVATTAALHALEGPVPQHIPLALIRIFFEQVVKGVVFLHQHGVAHTGIAPDHLLISPEGLLRIGNMVSACFCAPGERLHELRGTMHTVAPEVLRGEAYDPFLADAWALGVVLYFMLNRGRYPHDSANTLRHILHGHMRQPRPGLPTVVLDLLSRLMQAKPEDRLPVDAILAHPFFTATLPAAEEVQAGTAGEVVRTGRHDAAHGKINNNHINKTHLGDSSVGGNTSRVGGSHQPWDRGVGGAEDVDLDSHAGSFSAHYPQPQGTLFTNSALMAAGFSSSFDHLEAATFPPGGGELLRAIGNGSNADYFIDTSDNGSSFVSQRYASAADGPPTRLPPRLRSLATLNSKTFDFLSPVPAPNSPSSSSLVAKSRPVWRPELAPSIDALEGLAARVIQYHYRATLYRRKYKAETQALMKRGQDMLQRGNSSSDELSPSSQSTPNSPADSGRRASLLQTRQFSLRTGVPLLSNVPSTLSTKSQHSFHHRVSSSRSPLTGASTSNLSPSERRQKAAVHSGHGKAISRRAASSTSSASSSHPRRASSVGFTAAADGKMNPSRDRTNSNSVMIHTGAGPVQGDNVNEEYEKVRAEGIDDETGEEYNGYMNESSVRHANGSHNGSPVEGSEAQADDGQSPYSGSLTLPSLAITARGTDWTDGAPPQPQPQQQLRVQSGRSNRMLSNVANHSSPLPQGQRRSTISTVLCSVAPSRVSVDRLRMRGSAVGDGGACPLCHREPYAVRSISRRPYTGTPFQFSNGEFTKLPE